MNEYPKVYKKAIKGAVGGRLLNARGQEEEFLLTGDPIKADPTRVTVEIPDAEADKFFIKNNKPALINGYLIEVMDGIEVSFDETNAVSDGFLKDLLKQPFAKTKKRVEEFTSHVPVSRLLAFALEDNKPIKTIELLKVTLAKLQEKQPASSIAESDNIVVSTVN